MSNKFIRTYYAQGGALVTKSSVPINVQQTPPELFNIILETSFFTNLHSSSFVINTVSI